MPPIRPAQRLAAPAAFSSTFTSTSRRIASSMALEFISSAMADTTIIVAMVSDWAAITLQSTAARST